VLIRIYRGGKGVNKRSWESGRDGVREYRSAEVQEYRSTGVLEYRSAGVVILPHFVSP
jgi:hypothetical protein